MPPFVSCLVAYVVTIGFTAWMVVSGRAAHVLATDFTGMTVVVYAVFVATLAYAGHVARTVEIGTSRSSDPSRLRNLAFVAYTLPMLGFFGTVQGLIGMMEAADGVSAETFADVVSRGTSAALYPTAVAVGATVALNFIRFRISSRLGG